MTRARDLLESLTHPVLSAPMAGAAGGALAAAVTRAGGLGMIGFASTVTAQQLSAECAVAREGGRFGLGLMLWAVADRPAILDAALAEAPTLISLSFGDPGGPIERAHDQGALVACQAGTLAEAERALAAGSDILVARGSEGGGHGRGEVATLPLLQQLLELVGDHDDSVPVVAAGGIGTARGVAAALSAGAAGVWVGTPFAATVESAMPAGAKAAIHAADAADTVYTRAFDVAQRFSWPTIYGGRALANDFTRAWADRIGELEQAVAQDDTLTEQVTSARAQDDPALAPVYAGQSAAFVDRPCTAAEVMARLAGFREHLASAAGRWPPLAADATGTQA